MSDKYWQTKQGLWVPAFDKIWEQWIDDDLQFERHVLDCLLSHVPDGYFALDIGAHVGTDTIRLAQHFYSVHAFEPHPDNFECLSRNTAHLGNVKRHCCALGDTDGVCSLAYHGGNCGEYTVQEGADTLIQRLDSFSFVNIDAIKIDVEGFELRVLEGAKETLLRCRPAIILEVGDPTFRHHGIDRLAAPQYLTDLGAEKIAEDPTGGNWLFAWK